MAAIALAASCAAPGLNIGHSDLTHRPALTPSVSHPLKGEFISFLGNLGTSSRRSVTLQVLDASRKSWLPSDVKPVMSNGAGGFTFPRVEVDRTTTFRASSGTGDTEVSTRSVTIRPSTRKQTGSFKVLPRIASTPSSRTQDPNASLPVVSAHFAPARSGRTVRFQTRVDGDWKTVATTQQDSDGNSQAVLSEEDLKDSGKWRAEVAAYRGLAAHATAAADRTTWDTFIDEPFTQAQKPTDWSTRLGNRWLPDRTCAYVADSNTTYPGGVARLGTKAVSRAPSSIGGTAPGPDLFNARCKDASGEPQLYSGSMIMSGTDQQPITFTHGVAAARIKFDKRPGQHAAFWLQTSPLNDTEIDIIESRGQGFRKATVGLHVARGSRTITLQRSVGGVMPSGTEDDWYSRYHVYSVEWTPSQYVFRIDGREVYRTTRGASDTPHYVILSNFTADWEVQWNNGEDSAMDVDWVKVWQ